MPQISENSWIYMAFFILFLKFSILMFMFYSSSMKKLFYSQFNKTFFTIV